MAALTSDELAPRELATPTVHTRTLRSAGLGTVDAHGRILASPLDGDCGGIATFVREPMVFSEGRVALAVPHVPGRDLQTARSSNGWSEVMWIATAVATLRIEVSETMRRAPPLALVREVATRTMRVERDGSSLAVAFPMRLVTTDDVVLADAFATGADGYVVRVRLTADPASASRGGCRALVRALVATITPTRVRLDRRARSLAFAGLRVDLPFGLASHVEPGPDFDILRVSEPGSWLGIYDGNFPHRFHEGGPSFTREVLGETVSVFDARRHGTHHREFIVDLHDGSFRHVFYGAGDEAGFARMEAIAASIRAPDARSSQ